ncbi:MAG: outer membrane protein assembly factor BamD [archaeon]
MTDKFVKHFNRIFVLTIVGFLFGCSSGKETIPSDFSSYYERAQTAYEKKKWDKAIENFSMVVLNSPGGDLSDDAQYYLGECNFNKKEYLLAISEYQQLVERYTYSPLVEDGYYKIALSYFKMAPRYQLEQDNSLKALQNFQDFIDAFPNSKYQKDAEQKILEIRNRLARKLFESGRLYRKMQVWDSALLYLDKMLEDYYDSDWVTEAKIEKARCYIKLRQFDEYQKLLPEINVRIKTESEYSRSQYLKTLYEKELKKIAKEEKKKHS